MRLSFSHIHSITHLLPKPEISTFQLYAIVVPLVLDLVGNPIDRFCHDAVHLILQRFQVPNITFEKWGAELNLGPTFCWKNILTFPFSLVKDTNLRWVQFRIIHRILGTNSLLCKDTQYFSQFDQILPSRHERNPQNYADAV